MTLTEKWEKRPCESYYRPLFEVAGVKRHCERPYGHTRSWHQYTDEQGRRTQWEWIGEERAALVAAKRWEKE